MEILNESEYAPYFKNYIDLALNSSNDVHQNLNKTLEESNSFFSDFPIDKQLYRYADKKWTVKEILQHIIDTERILSYRALRIARNDKTILPGFDENKYVNNSNADQRDMDDLINEFKDVRRATISLFKSISRKSMNNTGITSDNNISVKALGYIISGHLLHHIKIIKLRYLQ